MKEITDRCLVVNLEDTGLTTACLETIGENMRKRDANALMLLNIHSEWFRPFLEDARMGYHLRKAGYEVVKKTKKG